MAEIAQERWDLVVVGGGWAGCAAAVEAARHGWRVALLEQGHQLGGRASSFVHAPSGEELDNGQHLFLGAYKETLRLLETLGTRQHIQFDPALRVNFLSEHGLLPFGGIGLPGPADLAWALAFTRYLGGAEKLQALTLGLRCLGDLLPAFFGHSASRKLASQSVAAWLAQAGQSPALIAKFWEPMCLAALNAAPAQARASEFVAVLGQGFLRGGSTAALGTSRVPLTHLVHPIGLFLKDKFGEAFVNATVEGVRPSAGGYEVSIRGEIPMQTQRVICALPAQAALRILGSELGASASVAAADPASPIVTVLCWHQDPMLPAARLAFAAQGQVQADFHWAFRLAPGSEGAQRSAFVASAAGALAELENASILERLYFQLEARLPGFSRAKVTRAQVLKERRATPLIALGAQRPSQATAFPGLALAGDWTETGLPATIEAAVRSGVKASRLLLDEGVAASAGPGRDRDKSDFLEAAEDLLD